MEDIILKIIKRRKTPEKKYTHPITQNAYEEGFRDGWDRRKKHY
jgi:hypothetical protein